jgi:hypothetical protein
LVSCRRRVFGAHVAADLGPFVVLLGQDGADKTGDRVTGREDAHEVGSAPDFFIQALLSYLESLAGVRCQQASGRWDELWTRQSPASPRTAPAASIHLTDNRTQTPQARPTTEIITHKSVVHPPGVAAAAVSHPALIMPGCCWAFDAPSWLDATQARTGRTLHRYSNQAWRPPGRSRHKDRPWTILRYALTPPPFCRMELETIPTLSSPGHYGTGSR